MVSSDYRVFRIKTQVTEDGGAIREGDKVRKITRYTGKTENIETQETTTYTRQELNRSIINPAQIKLILETYRDAVIQKCLMIPKENLILTIYLRH